MNNNFIFKTNLNDIFIGNEIRNSETPCYYCTSRKRICKCDTIRKEIGSDKIKELVDLETLRKSYDEICEKIADRYSDVISRFEYDKDLVRFVKKYKINDEIENEDWFYFYELLKDRNIIERFVEVQKRRGNGAKGEKCYILNSFHFDEEANFLSCLNYYLKVNGMNSINHGWMGMSENPFQEYETRRFNLYNKDATVTCEKTHHSNDKDDTKGDEVGGREGDEENEHEHENKVKQTNNILDIPEDVKENPKDENMEKIQDILNKGQEEKRRTFLPLYYNLHVQENGKWISGLDNSGHIFSHPENIDYVWNRTVREKNKIKLFQLITANSIKRSVSDYYKFEKKQTGCNGIYSSDGINNDRKSIHGSSDYINYSIMDELLCLSHIICGLGMLDVGGFFIIKTKIFFDNMFLSIFSILSICFKKLEIYRPSCCYTKNVVFLIGSEFNGISSIFLSTLTGWIKEALREMQLVLDFSSHKDNKKNSSSTISRHYTNRSVIPQRWIRNLFFQEYKNCIKYFIDYLIYHLKNCVNISNINLNRAKIENTKNYYISQFFENNKIAELERKDKLLHRVVEIYEDNELVNRNYLLDMYNSGNENESEKGALNETGTSGFNINTEESDNSSYCETTYNTKKSAFIKKEMFRIEDIKAVFSDSVEMCVDSEIHWKRYTADVIRLLKRIKYRREKEHPIVKPNCVLNTQEMKCKGKDLFFQIDTSILEKRVFTFSKKNAVYIQQEERFINLLQRQRYFSNKPWFHSVLRKNISTFEKSFYLKKNLYTEILKCRNYLYHNKCYMHVNSIKQLLKEYQPIHTSYIKYELNVASIGLLFVLRNCINVDIFNDSGILENFVVISTEPDLYNFLSKFEKGIHVTLVSKKESTIITKSLPKKRPLTTESSSLPNSQSSMPFLQMEHNRMFFANIEELYEIGKPYKHFSELLINKFKHKNMCSFIYIDLNDHLSNYVHILQKEIMGKNVFVASLIIALNYLKKQGILIIRLSSILTFFSAGLIYILFCAFEKVQFFLPPSCDDTELDFYICCINFNANFIYRHYVQYIWDFLICNKHVDKKKNSNNAADKNKQEKKKEKGICDLYYSVPLPFVMNRHFVKFLKKFNSFYFKQHINVCLTFLKEPRIFHGNKILAKYVLAHFYKAFIIKKKTFQKVLRSLSLSGEPYLSIDSNNVNIKGEKTVDSETECEGESESESESDEEEDKEQKEKQSVEKQTLEYKREENKKKRTITDMMKSENVYYNENISILSTNDLIDKQNQKLETSSSYSNYSISYEYENVPSEISVSDSAWQSD